MFLVDVGQLFRCAGHHFMCVTTGPPIRGDPISHSQAHIPLKPLPPCSRPLPRSNQPLTRNKQKSVKHRGPLTAPLCKFIFSLLANHPFLVKRVLFDGWVPGQAGFTFLPYWGGGEDAQASKGSERAGWSMVAAFCSPSGAPTALCSVSFAVPFGWGLCTRESFHRCVQGNVQASMNNGRVHWEQPKRPIEAKYYETNSC